MSEFQVFHLRMVDSLPADIWLVRPCEVYKEEYRDCKTVMSRLYHYYIGQKTDCTTWLTDYNNCMMFRQTKNHQAALAVLESERQRRKIRIQNSNANDIWEYRTSPPAEWSAPLSSNEEKSNS